MPRLHQPRLHRGIACVIAVGAMLLLQGTADHEVRAAGSVALARKAQAAHDNAELKRYPGVGHMALLLALSRPMQHQAPSLSDVLVFIKAHER